MSAKSFTIEEVAKHRIRGDFWTIVDGSVYDLSNFVAHHPGGSLILSGGGTDSTVLYHTYHFQSRKRVDAVLAKYKIGEYNGTICKMGAFYEKLTERVSEELNVVEKRPLLGKLLFFFDLIAYVMLLCYSLTLDHNSDLALIFCIWLAFFGAFNSRLQQQEHALGHFHLFSPRITAILDYVMIFLGVMSAGGMALSTNGNVREKSHLPRKHAQHEFGTGVRGPYEHQAIHHVKGVDFDSDDCFRGVKMSDLLRLRDWDPFHFYHRFQTSPLYLLLLDYLTLSVIPILGIVVTRSTLFRAYMKSGEYLHALACISTLFPFAVIARLFYLLPLANSTIGQITGPLLFLSGLTLMHLLSLSTSRGLYFFAQHKWDSEPVPEEVANKDWGRYNALTTYSLWPQPVESFHPIFWFQNGTCPSTLSYHMEHTLFPGVHYLHLKRIAPVIKKVCEEFSIPYRTLHGVGDVYKEKQRMLEKCCRPKTL